MEVGLSSAGAPSGGSRYRFVLLLLLFLFFPTNNVKAELVNLTGPGHVTHPDGQRLFIAVGRISSNGRFSSAERLQKSLRPHVRRLVM